MKHLDHFEKLMETFEFIGDICHRLHSDSIEVLKKSFKQESDKVKKDKKYQMIQKIKAFLELYQTYHIKDYDYWEFKNSPTFSLFVEKFEKES